MINRVSLAHLAHLAHLLIHFVSLPKKFPVFPVGGYD